MSQRHEPMIFLNKGELSIYRADGCFLNTAVEEGFRGQLQIVANSYRDALKQHLDGYPLLTLNMFERERWKIVPALMDTVHAGITSQEALNSAIQTCVAQADGSTYLQFLFEQKLVKKSGLPNARYEEEKSAVDAAFTEKYPMLKNEISDYERVFKLAALNEVMDTTSSRFVEYLEHKEAKKAERRR